MVGALTSAALPSIQYWSLRAKRSIDTEETGWGWGGGGGDGGGGEGGSDRTPVGLLDFGFQKEWQH